MTQQNSAPPGTPQDPQNAPHDDGAQRIYVGRYVKDVCVRVTLIYDTRDTESLNTRLVRFLTSTGIDDLPGMSAGWIPRGDHPAHPMRGKRLSEGAAHYRGATYIFRVEDWPRVESWLNSYGIATEARGATDAQRNAKARRVPPSPNVTAAPFANAALAPLHAPPASSAAGAANVGEGHVLYPSVVPADEEDWDNPSAWKTEADWQSWMSLKRQADEATARAVAERLKREAATPKTGQYDHP